MDQRTFPELVQDLRQRREVGDPPPVVLLGAGASVEAGVGAMTELFAFVGSKDFAEFSEYIRKRTPPERFRLLSRFLQSQRPAEVTGGYRALADLCAEAYFDVVLTTNLDPLLDDALANARLWRKDYLLLVNGVVLPDWLKMLLNAPSPRVKVVKLHGDLFHRCMAWTVAEMDTFLQGVAPFLQVALANRDLLVVGHSLRDARIREMVETAGGTIWYATPGTVPDFLQANPNVRAVTGPDCTFERLFPALARDLDLDLSPAVPATPAVPPVPPPAIREEVTRGGLSFNLSKGAEPAAETAGAAISPGAATLDDAMASIVAVAAEDGTAMSTAFLIAGTRLVVTDGYPLGDSLQPGSEVTLIAAGNRRMRAQVLYRAGDSPFGPVVLEAPAELQVPGLHLDPGKIPAELAIRIGVAAGERIGVSSGRILAPRERSEIIAPLGRVDHLVSIDSVVAPGASGAPVLDSASLAVRGFIVAGNRHQPPAWMLPARHWARELSAVARRIKATRGAPGAAR